MVPAWRLEWRRALARQRLFAFNVAVPTLLVAFLVFGGAPAVHAGVAYTLLFVFFGTFGAAIPLVRDAESGLLERIALTGIEPGSLLAERVLAGATIDLLQLAPAVVLIGVVGQSGAILPGLGALLLSLVVTNALGVGIGAVARSMAESALFAAVTCLLLLHASGVFRTPRPGSPGAAVQRIAPFGPLHRAVGDLTGLETGGTASSDAAVAPVWCAAAVLLTWLSGRFVLGRFGSASRG